MVDADLSKYSPLLANRYADDFVILSRGKATEALEWTRVVVTRLGLTLNEAKTSVKEARKESFNFPGLHVRAASLPEGWPLVSGSESVEEGGGAYQAESGRGARSRQQGAVARGAGSAESDVTRMVDLLQLWNPDAGVSGDRSSRCRLRTAFPAEASQGVIAWHCAFS